MTKNPNDEAEQQLLVELREKGISIVVEEPDHKIGHLSRYAIVGRRGTDESDPTIEALGDDRLSALKALSLRASIS